jgi:hypothetical protein
MCVNFGDRALGGNTVIKRHQIRKQRIILMMHQFLNFLIEFYIVYFLCLKPLRALLPLGPWQTLHAVETLSALGPGGAGDARRAHRTLLAQAFGCAAAATALSRALRAAGLGERAANAAASNGAAKSAATVVIGRRRRRLPPGYFTLKVEVYPSCTSVSLEPIMS